ncbi:MAG: hypothetical protein CMM99_02815 [Rickettsiales bacterium]|nr:hypothetical protein [Rickettsiales bacterium]|tara:strand:- start:114 stop:386 length:273 start_codon:yes stop_codon:yes gene_type:complete
MSKEKLKEFKEKINKIEAKKTSSKNPKFNNNLSIGFKISLDLVSPIIAGILIGIGVDKFFSTKPIFFVIFLLLGIVAGFFNILKSAKNFK